MSYKLTPSQKKQIKKPKALENKYSLYEMAVQEPDEHIKMFNQMYHAIHRDLPHVLREDFCGTFLISTHWVKQGPKNSALCLDLDSEPLEYGKKNHLKKLSVSEQKRIHILQQNVISNTSRHKKADIVAACNFSFYIFKDRDVLLQYFKNTFASLAKGGLFILEMAGGPGFINSTKEQRTMRHPKFGKYTYVWHQKKFNPIDCNGHYSINFKFPNGDFFRDVFVYDWRVWSITEVLDVMKDAGFTDCHVYWETSHKGEGTGEYLRLTEGDNAYSWISYVVGVKST